MIKKLTVTLLFLITISVYSQQEKINNYKYLIVPDKFEYLKTADQYQTSSLTKFLLKKKGFTVFLSSDKLPSELQRDNCKAITATVIDDSSMFTIKSIIQLKDCFGTVLYTSKSGRSKEKDYKKAYQESIREAYATMSDLEYEYKAVKEDVVENNPIKVDVVTPVKTIPEVKKVVVSSEVSLPSTKVETLYAQAKPNGFQLVNTKPAIIFQVLKTNVKEVFIIKDKNGILYKNNTTWIAEYYENDKLVIKKYMINF